MCLEPLLSKLLSCKLTHSPLVNVQLASRWPVLHRIGPTEDRKWEQRTDLKLTTIRAPRASVEIENGLFGRNPNVRKLFPDCCVKNSRFRVTLASFASLWHSLRPGDLIPLPAAQLLDQLMLKVSRVKDYDGIKRWSNFIGAIWLLPMTLSHNWCSIHF